MSRKHKKKGGEETPHDMMKRVFAVAELIVSSDGYRLMGNTSAELPKKHNPADLLYRKDQQGNLGITDGTEEA